MGCNGSKSAEVNTNNRKEQGTKPEGSECRPDIENSESEVQNNKPEVQHIEPGTRHTEPEIQHTKPEVQHTEQEEQNPETEPYSYQEPEVQKRDPQEHTPALVFLPFFRNSLLVTDYIYIAPKRHGFKIFQKKCSSFLIFSS